MSSPSVTFGRENGSFLPATTRGRLQSSIRHSLRTTTWPLAIAGLSEVALESRMSDLVQNALSAASQSAYKSGVGKWLEFQRRYEVKTPLLPTEHVMCKFVTWRRLPLQEGGGNVQGTTISTYLSWIRWHYVTQGLSDPVLGRMQLGIMLQAA